VALAREKQCNRGTILFPFVFFDTLKRRTIQGHIEDSEYSEYPVYMVQIVSLVTIDVTENDLIRQCEKEVKGF
jgi:hypothetical protein